MTSNADLIAEVIAYNSDAEDSHYDGCYQRHAGCLAVMLREPAAPDAATEVLDAHRCDESAERAYKRTIRAEAERDAALAAIERMAALHIESDWKCGNPRHTNPEIGCPECYTECETCDRTYPCDTRAALDGAPEPEVKP